MSDSLVKRAYIEYQRGNYAAALDIYRLLAEQLGEQYFTVNIQLCQANLNNHEKNSSVLDKDLILAKLAKGHAKDSTAESSNKPHNLNRGLVTQSGEKKLSTNIQNWKKRLKRLLKAISNSIRRRSPSQYHYRKARFWFYRQGRITDTLSLLNDLEQKGLKFDKEQRNFKAFVDGLARLKQGWIIPPSQPNAGLFARRQQILYCLHQSVPHATNGYSTRSHGIASGLQQSGWRVRAATRPGFPWDAGIKGLNKGYHEAQLDGVTYAAVSGWNLNKTPLDYYLSQAADHYLREAQTSGAEMIIAASNHITALPALLAARRLGLPFIYEVRGLWEITKASTQPEWAQSERYQLMCALESQAACEADLVITLTEELADELVLRGVQRERIVIVPNAVDAERFSPQEQDTGIALELRLKPGVPVIGYAGSAVAYEGLELLLEALAKLKQANKDFIFVLVGDGKVIDDIKAKAQKLDIESYCRFTGRVPFEQVPGYLSCMDIMPVPRLSSAVTEMVSALKPFEAMAMGKAVVLSDVSPHKIMAGEGGRARLFNKDSVGSLVDALGSLIANPKERVRMGKAARRWIEQERTWNQVTATYCAALGDLRQRFQADHPIKGETVTPRSFEEITLGLIADQFTTDTLASTLHVIPLSPDNWCNEIADQPIDALFVESAWKGNGGLWHRKIGYYTEEEFAPLQALLAHCHRQGTPSLFWNKEDPVHYERFRKAASLCDHVFTTDSRRIIPYLSTPGTLTKTVSSCPFYASPRIHNLLPPKDVWKHTAAYGGTYYGKRYPERTEYMDKIMSAAVPLGLTIYDRQHDDPDSPYKYPAGLSSYVVGSLSYQQMIQAYKSHPVQINVNSVLDSPTMFSRRVMEAAACGAPIISGPALGMNRYTEGAAQIVLNETEAAQVLENLLHHPAYRWRLALKGARAVMRAHTTGWRLTQMLRTAGVVVAAPELSPLHLFAPAISEAAARQVLAQTWRPVMIVAKQWQDSAKEQLQQAGIVCSTETMIQTEVRSHWILAETSALEVLEPEDMEDLAWAATYASCPRIGYCREAEPSSDGWPGLAMLEDKIDTGIQLVQVPADTRLSDLPTWVGKQQALTIRKPFKKYDQAPNIPPKKTILIAGHDLKFIKPFYPYFSKAGLRILLDIWNGHTQHDESMSKRLLQQADTVFCEWMLGNAIWYGNHKLSGQRLVGRLHAQELRSPLYERLPFDKFDKVIFVGPHILRQAKSRNLLLKNNGTVIQNGVDLDALQLAQRKPTNGKVLGFVGMVPQSKRLDLALDIIHALRKQDKQYTLRIKGKRPDDFPWMANRIEEKAWYAEQYKRLSEDPLLKGAVFFDAHGNDMPEWYAGIDFVLSTSDHESFHFSVADGAAAGCIPVILPWEGADEIYPKDWIVPDTRAAVDLILNYSGRHFPKSISHYIEKKFSLDNISSQIIEIINTE